MTIKTCLTCKEEKPESEFSYKNKASGTRQPVCKSCHSIYTKKWYIENSDRHRANTKKWNDKHFNTAREFVTKYLLGHPCVDCGNSDVRVLDFDHVRGDKKSEIAIMVRNGSSINSISKEIEKCDVRCSNCHRIS